MAHSIVRIMTRCYMAEAVGVECSAIERNRCCRFCSCNRRAFWALIPSCMLNLCAILIVRKSGYMLPLRKLTIRIHESIQNISWQQFRIYLSTPQILAYLQLIYHTRCNTLLPTDASFTNVPCITLDNFVFNRGNPAPLFIKIDVEGAELAVIQESNRLLSEIKPVVVAEVRREYEDAVFAIMTQKGYRQQKVCDEIGPIGGWLAA